MVRESSRKGLSKRLRFSFRPVPRPCCEVTVRFNVRVQPIHSGRVNVRAAKGPSDHSVEFGDEDERDDEEDEDEDEDGDGDEDEDNWSADFRSTDPIYPRGR